MGEEKWKPDLTLSDEEQNRCLVMDLYDVEHEPQRFANGSEAHQLALKRAIAAEQRLKETEVVFDLLCGVAFLDPRTNKKGTILFHRMVTMPPGSPLPDCNAKIFGFVYETPEDIDFALGVHDHWILAIRNRVWNVRKQRWQILCVPMKQEVEMMQPIPLLDEETAYKMFCKDAGWRKIREDIYKDKPDNCDNTED